MSKFEHLTEPNKFLPALETMFAECGRIKQTVSNIQRALKERFGLGAGLDGPCGSLPNQEVL